MKPVPCDNISYRVPLFWLETVFLITKGCPEPFNWFLRWCSLPVMNALCKCLVWVSGLQKKCNARYNSYEKRNYLFCLWKKELFILPDMKPVPCDNFSYWVPLFWLETVCLITSSLFIYNLPCSCCYLYNNVFFCVYLAFLYPNNVCCAYCQLFVLMFIIFFYLISHAHIVLL